MTRKTILIGAIGAACLAPSAEARDVQTSPSADARVEETSPTTNYADWNLKAAGSTTSPPCGAPSACIQSYLKFAVALGPNEKVGSARLVVTPALPSDSGFQTRGAENNWTETGITWANRPALQGTGGASGRTTCTSADCVSVDVSQIVPWNGGYTTLAVTSDNYFEAYSKEDGYDLAPELAYTTAPYADTQPPTAPVLRQTGATTRSASVAWEPATDDIYVAYLEPLLNGSPQNPDSVIHTGGGPLPDSPAYRNWTYTGLACGSSYTATVIAKDPTANASAPNPLTITTAPCGTPLLEETFSKAHGSTWVSSDAFWTTADLGASENADWFAENGKLTIDNYTGKIVPERDEDPNVPVDAQDWPYRMWTRGTDYGDVKVTHDLKIDGWVTSPAARKDWHGVKLWLRRKFCTPDNNPTVAEPRDCERIKDSGSQAGYTAEYALHSGQLLIQKRIPYGTPGAPPAPTGCAHANGSIILKQTPKKSFPVSIGTNRLSVGATVKNNPDGSSVTIQVFAPGGVAGADLEVTDYGTAAQCGPAHRDSGRIGLRTDNVNAHIDNLVVKDFP